MSSVGINQVSLMSQIPLMNQDKGVAVDIFSRLPVGSVGACSLVCKDWNNLLKSKYYSEKFLLWQRVAYCQFPFIAQMKIPIFDRICGLAQTPEKECIL